MSAAVEPEATTTAGKAGLDAVRRDGLRHFLLTTLAYVAAGLAALPLAVPPGYGSPLYPAAGIALAGVLVYGRRMVGAVGLGAFFVNAALIAARGSHGWGAYAMPAVVAVAAALQAGLGALLIRRFVTQPLTLTLPADMARFMAACTASSVVSASVSTAALGGFGLLSSDRLPFTWGTWWVGDLSGLLIATPIVLTVIGQPASAWLPRRLPVGATLAFVTGLLAVGIVQVSRWNDERMRATFDHEASTASLGVIGRLQEPLQALEALRGAADRGIRVSEDLDPGAEIALGDATRVKQILTNLLSNAVKYNRDGGRVHVTSRSPAANRVEISVIDTGLGLTAVQLSELFKPFNRLGRERTATQGTGIGLVISQRLAELMGGTIGVKSLPGEGSSFTLVLPRAIDADTVRDDLTPEETKPTDYHRRLVHYVEDNETNVEVMRGILALRPQVRLEVSMTGLDGLAAMRARRPHLLLLDMHLPDISGLELLRHLKAATDTADIPVVAVSADAMAEQIEAALAAGADRYLTKPVAVAEFLATVDGLLDRAETDFG